MTITFDESKCGGSYRYSDKYLAPQLQVTYRYNDKKVHTLWFFQSVAVLIVIVYIILQIELQITYRYNDKNYQCLPKLTNIHSSYSYNDK